MSQILFVLKDGQVAFWKYSRGCLVRATLKGNRWNDFTSDYWSDWKDANQIGDSVDAILLASTQDDFGALPNWLQKSKDSSAWTTDVLSKLAKDADFTGKGIVLSLGENKYTLVPGDPTECYSLISSFAFTLPKELVKAPEPSKPVEKKPEPPKSTGIIGDSFNDPEALKLSVGAKLNGVVEKIFKAMKRNYVRVEGLKEQVCFKSVDEKNFNIGDNVALTVTTIDNESNRVLFSIEK